MVDFSCNACLRIAARRDIRIGTHVHLRQGLTGEVAAVTHLLGKVHLLIAGDMTSSSLWLPLQNAQPVIA